MVVNLENHAEFGPKVLPHIAGPLPKEYAGEPRLIVLCVRSVLQSGEPLRLKAIVLDNARPKSAALHWRPLGQGEFRTVPLQHVARATYRVELPAPDADFEYRIEAETADGHALAWPATAQAMNQTVVVW